MLTSRKQGPKRRTSWHERARRRRKRSGARARRSPPCAVRQRRGRPRSRPTARRFGRSGLSSSTTSVSSRCDSPRLPTMPPRDCRSRTSRHARGKPDRFILLTVTEQSAESDQPRRDVPPEIRNASFDVARRGYERSAVDAYVARVTGLIDDLEATRSPEAAVKHALREAGETISSTLLQAGETAEQITVAARQTAEAETTRARKEADALVANATAEAENMRELSNAEAERIRAEAKAEAEVRLRELEADTEMVRTERRALLDDIRALAARVEQAAKGANARFPLAESAEPTQEAGAAANPDRNGATS